MASATATQGGQHRLHVLVHQLVGFAASAGDLPRLGQAMPGPNPCAGTHAITRRKVVMKKKPLGGPERSDFEIVEEAMPAIKDGEMLLRTRWLSLDPYMRGLGSHEDTKKFGGFMREDKNVGSPVIGGTVSEVLESQAAGWNKGDLVVGYYGWQDYSIGTPQDVQWGHPKWPIEKWDNSLGPPSTALGVLGMTGYTAYFGLLEVAKLKTNETVVVSAASGAVGQVVGQIAKIHGCRVVGVAGGPLKCSYVVDELGFDACIDYKDTSSDMQTRLKKAVPNGIDVYFENVGGAVLEAVIPLLNPGSRVPVCGWVSQYNSPTHQSPLARLAEAGLKRLGGKNPNEGFRFFTFMEFVPRYPEAQKAMSAWIKEGKLKYRESINQGLDSSIDAFRGMLQGENFGKTLVQIS